MSICLVSICPRTIKNTYRSTYRVTSYSRSMEPQHGEMFSDYQAMYSKQVLAMRPCTVEHVGTTGSDTRVQFPSGA